MKTPRPYYPAIWFLLGALVASEPWSWIISAPADLSAHQMQMIGTIWRAAFAIASFLGFFGYAAGIALFRSHPVRWISTTLGALFGIAIVGVIHNSFFSSLDFGPIALPVVATGFLLGIAVGFSGRIIDKSKPD